MVWCNVNYNLYLNCCYCYRKREMYCSLLSKVPILENLTDEEQHIVADALEQVTFKRGEVIIQQGDPGKDFYIIIEGTVVCMQYAKKGRYRNVGRRI